MAHQLLDDTALLDQDELQVEFDYGDEQQHLPTSTTAPASDGCSTTSFVVAMVCCGGISIGLVVLLTTKLASQFLAVGLVLCFVVLLAVACCISAICRPGQSRVTQKCTVTSTQLLIGLRGFDHFDKQIPLTQIRDVVIVRERLLQSLLIDTGSYRVVNSNAGARGWSRPELGTNDGRRALTPEIELRGVKDPVKVREFIFAKQRALGVFPNQSQTRMVIPIAQQVHVQVEPDVHKMPSAPELAEEAPPEVQLPPNAPELEVEQMRERLAQLEAQLSRYQAQEQTLQAPYHEMK